MTWNTITLNGEKLYTKGIYTTVGESHKATSLNVKQGFVIAWSDDSQMFMRTTYTNSQEQGISLLANTATALMD